MSTTTDPGRILRSAFWRAIDKPEEPGDLEWWTRTALGARDAAAAAYKYEGMASAIHAAACFLGREFWAHPGHARWKPRDQADHVTDLTVFRAAATSLLTTLQRQRTPA